MTSDTDTAAGGRTCWVCGAAGLVRVRDSTIGGRLSDAEFRISSADYGRTAAIDRCGACGFHQCTDLVDVLGFYEDMADPVYAETRAQRALQERAVLRGLDAGPPDAPRRLLDVGAGSGILVEEALKIGFRAEGVEPSRALQEQAVALGLPVHRGVLPHPDLAGPYDAVTLVDVIEHVPDPVGLLETAAALLAPDGVLVVVTPDRRSLAARLMGWRWWHYRIAHIGYFDRATLDVALDRAGLRRTGLRRPVWYFPLDYLVERAVGYLPRALRFRCPAFLAKLTVPLNLFDSLVVTCRRIPPDAG